MLLAGEVFEVVELEAPLNAVASGNTPLLGVAVIAAVTAFLIGWPVEAWRQVMSSLPSLLPEPDGRPSASLIGPLPSPSGPQPLASCVIAASVLASRTVPV